MKVNGYKEKLILLGGLVGIGAISLAITLTVYNVQFSNEMNGKDELDTEIVFRDELTEAQRKVAQNLISELEKLENAPNDEEVSINNKDDAVNNNEIKVENEFKNIEENEVENENGEMKNNDDINSSMIMEVSAKVNNLSFIKPLEGDVGMGYSNDNLVYLKTLDEWRTHNGIDILAEVGSSVKASSDGVVRYMYDDVMYGFTIILEHDDGYVTRYSGVEANDLLEVGQDVKQGDVIAVISKPNGFEIDEGSHLHFEIVKDGENLEPRFD